MSSFLSHIVHGVESGLMTLATTGNPALAAGAGFLGAVSDGGSGAPGTGRGAAASPLLQMLQAESPSEQRSVKALSQFAGGAQVSPFAEMVGA